MKLYERGKFLFISANCWYNLRSWSFQWRDHFSSGIMTCVAINIVIHFLSFFPPFFYFFFIFFCICFFDVAKNGDAFIVFSLILVSSVDGRDKSHFQVTFLAYHFQLINCTRKQYSFHSKCIRLFWFLDIQSIFINIHYFKNPNSWNCLYFKFWCAAIFANQLFNSY